ncbi:hypothetical protein D9756_010612 [Leucocoprinus leucothites]|uniref:Uncharacterized protein n=1 Tax=Leucocoprinus leucothites TaxID=201217 RepID=A0A8H5FRG2_9AGAR|nr:hypothetical protein D9756_010612 [Leucoagaricus leucothites]
MADLTVLHGSNSLYPLTHGLFSKSTPRFTVIHPYTPASDIHDVSSEGSVQHEIAPEDSEEGERGRGREERRSRGRRVSRPEYDSSFLSPPINTWKAPRESPQQQQQQQRPQQRRHRSQRSQSAPPGPERRQRRLETVLEVSEFDSESLSPLALRQPNSPRSPLLLPKARSASSSFGTTIGTTRGGELLPPPPPLLRPTTFWRKTRRSGVTGASYSPSSHLIRRSTYIAAGLQFDAPIHDLSALCVESRSSSPPLPPSTPMMMMMISQLFIPLFILVYLSSTLVALPVLVYNPSRRQNNPPIPPPSIPTSTTFNYWWPYPPAGVTTTTTPSATQVVAPAPTTADHNPITLVLPLPPSPSPSTSFDPTLTSSSSPTTTGDDETSSTSTSSTTPTPSPTTSLTNSNSNTLTGSSSEHKKLNPLYILIPLTSFVGVVCLLLVGWLLWGCCTRRPKYHIPPPPLRSKMDEEEEEREGEKCGLSGSVSADVEFEGLGEGEGRFKAFRYEDFPSFDGDGQEDGEGEEGEVKRCEHTREYGFECDCRLSVVEGEMYREKFKWPGIGDFIREDEEGEEGGRRFSLSSNRTKSGERQISPVSSTVPPLSTTTSLSYCSTTTTDITTSHPPSRSSSSSSSTSTIKPKPIRPLTTTTAAAGHHATTIGTDTIGRQTKLLESVQLLEALDRCEREGTLPRPRKFRTWRAVQSVKRGRDRGGRGRSELQMMFDEGERRELKCDGDGEGTVRPRRDKVSTGVSGEESGKERESWVGRMVRSLSRFSNSSASSGDGGAAGGGGGGGDRYTSLPPSTSFTRASQSPTKTTTRKKNKEKKAKKISLSRHPQSSHHTSDPPHPPHPPHLQPTTETVTETDLLVEQIHRQKLRLARHRESIASLPSGMVYSPALVQMSGGMAFGAGEERGESDKERGEEKREREKRLPPRPF